MLIAMGLISLMSVVTLRDELAGSDADAASLDVAGHTLVALHDWTFLLGPQFCAGFGNGILLGFCCTSPVSCHVGWRCSD